MTSIGKKVQHKKPHAHGKEEQYIDLGAMTFDHEALGAHSGSQIKIAEIYRFEDLRTLTKHVYAGHTIIIDYTALSNDDMALRRISSELHAVAEDTNGDVAGIGNNMMVVTSGGLTIDRKKIRGSF
jgi:SepF-like predicted cell division protein (DUF552 family)